MINELGTLRQVTPHEVESLFAADLAFLQDLYGIINFGDPADVEVLQRAVVPTAEPPRQPVDEPVTADVSPAGAATGSFDSSWGSRARGLIEEVSTPNGS